MFRRACVLFYFSFFDKREKVIKGGDRGAFLSQLTCRWICPSYHPILRGTESQRLCDTVPRRIPLLLLHDMTYPRFAYPKPAPVRLVHRDQMRPDGIFGSGDKREKVGERAIVSVHPRFRWYVHGHRRGGKWHCSPQDLATRDRCHFFPPTLLRDQSFHL